MPAPTAGETQTFEFTFQLPGYQPTTVTASPVNNTINLNAVNSKPYWPATVVPPRGAPNVLLIIADDFREDGSVFT